MNFLLDATAAPSTLGEKLVYGGRMVLIGMLTVFLVLSILWLSLELLHFLLHRGDKAKAKKEEAAAVAEPAPAPIMAAAPAEDEDEIAAVIAAAIYAAEESTPQSKFRAVSFKRIH